MIIKLQKGQAVDFTVTSVVLDVPATNPKYGPSTKFVGHTPDDPDACLFLSPATADRQLARLGLTTQTVVGQTVEFAKPGEYVDINRASVSAAQPPQTATAPAPVPASKAKQGFTSGAHIPEMDDEPAPAENGAGKVEQLKKLASLHKRCLQFVLDEEAPLLLKSDVGDSPESVSARTAQLFIAATNAGLHR